MFPKKKKSRLIAATDVLQSLFENGKSPLSAEFVRWKMSTEWSAVVGDTVAQNSRPDRVFKKILYIAVSHPAWVQQLRFMQKEIIRSVNKYNNKEWIEEVKFFVDSNADSTPQQTSKD